jgi:hypothetical protein
LLDASEARRGSFSPPTHIWKILEHSICGRIQIRTLTQVLLDASEARRGAVSRAAALGSRAAGIEVYQTLPIQSHYDIFEN